MSSLIINKTYFVSAVTDHRNAKHVFLLILIFKVLHNKEGGETNKGTTNPPRLSSSELLSFFHALLRSHVCPRVCCGSGGRLCRCRPAPLPDKGPSAAISVAVQLGGIAHTIHRFARRGDR